MNRTGTFSQENIIISSTFVPKTIVQYESDGKVSFMFNVNCGKRRSRSPCQTKRFHHSHCHFRETFGQDIFKRDIPCYRRHPEKASRETCFSTTLRFRPVSRSILDDRQTDRNEEGQLSKVGVIGDPHASNNLAGNSMDTTNQLPVLSSNNLTHTWPSPL